MAEADLGAETEGESDAQADGGANPNPRWQNVSIIKMVTIVCDMGRSFPQTRMQKIVSHSLQFWIIPGERKCRQDRVPIRSRYYQLGD